ncbi:MAG: transglycosylase domain-containing protein [Akkermansia sp.]
MRPPRQSFEEPRSDPRRDRDSDWRRVARDEERFRRKPATHSYEEEEEYPPYDEYDDSPPPPRRAPRCRPRYENDYDYMRPPRKPKITIFGIIWFILTFPFRIIFQFTRHLRWFAVWPLRLFLSIAFVGLVVGGILIFLYGTIANRYDISEVLKMPERTIVLDRKNREIGRLHGTNRKQVKLEEVPPIFIDALLLREDSRFYSHGGVDWIGVGRAVAQVAKHKRATQGASTLTMQLAKTTFNHQKRNLNAKLTEVALAKRIEAAYSKKQILEAYINRIFWGHTFMGISSAARGYFSKEPSQLTVSECAMLAGIIYGPNDFSPYKNPAKAKEARNIVLRLLKDHQKISQDIYQQALNEPIVTHKPESRSEENYAMDLIRRELDNILEEENIRLGGLVVRTTLDLDLQNSAIDSINKHLSALESTKKYKHTTRRAYMALPKEKRDKTTPGYVQAATVVIDNASGALLVVVGGRDGEESRFNRAIQSRRQVGSLFKPFVYATFFEKGYSPSTQVSDGPIRPGEIPGARNWSPRNSDNTFRGMQSASFGLVKSRNTMSVRIGHLAGLKNVIQHASLAGFQGKTSVSPAVYLGTWEASPLDVASAYTTFANGGVRPTPYIIETISDAEDQVLFYSKKTTRRAYTQRAANLTSSLLQQVTRPGGTAGKMSTLGFKAPCGGKTGTTNKYMNAWFAGFSQSLAASVWVGFDQQKTIIEKGYGGTLALPIWADIMHAAQQSGYPCGDIRKSSASSGKAIWMCRESGQIAHTGCQDAHTAYYETIPDVDTPTKMCEKHIPLAEPVNEGNPIPDATPVGASTGTSIDSQSDNKSPNDDDIPLAEPLDENDDDIPLAEPI